MKRPSKVRKRARKAPSRKASKAKRAASSKAARSKPDPAARLRKQLKARTAELEEARAQQSAADEVLQVINASRGDLKPALDCILEKAHMLCGAPSGSLQLYEDGRVVPVAIRGMTPAFEAYLAAGYPITDGIRPGLMTDRPAQFDVADAVRAQPNEPSLRAALELGRFRTLLTVPLVKDGRTFGRIVAGRKQLKPFAARQIELLQGFAAQAAIAIENARLLTEVQQRTKELSDALLYQTGSANILKIIASSPTDVAPVLQAISESACELCEAVDASVLLKDGNNLKFSGHHGPLPVSQDSIPIERGSISGRAFLDQEPVHVADLQSADGRFPKARELAVKHGARTVVSVPLIRAGESIGAIVARRTKVRPFTAKQIDMIRTFGDQAVIAIQNARLFNETKEALEQQTATADILKVIASSPSDVQPVFQAIADRSNRLVNGLSTTVLTIEGDTVRLAAFTNTSPEADAALLASFPRRLSEMTFGGETTFEKAMISGRVFSVPDTEDEPALRDLARLRGYRSMLFVPLVRDGRQIGMIGQTRTEPGSFPEPHIALLKTFADQAVIAISNVSLFSQVREKTLELEEALGQQTATAEVLQAISRSTFDLNTILHTLIGTAAQLCNTGPATIFLRDGDVYRWAASQILEPSYLEHEKRSVIRAGRGTLVGRVALEKRVIHIADLLEDPEYEEKDAFRLANLRTALCVPMLRDGEPIGVFCLAKDRVEPFSENEIRLISTFADQAVIAIQNVQLFEQVQQRTGELSQSLDDLRAAQDRLVQTEKLASLGQLTAGIAHEIKNPLNFVNNFSALSAELVDELDDVLADAPLAANRREELDEIRALLKGNLEKVVQHGKRADSIVKNMLLHSRDGSGEQRSADVNALVDESLNLAYHGARAEKQSFNITLERDFDPSAGMADIFPQEITRVFLNLISNGFYAATKRAAEAGNGFEPVLRAVTRNLGEAIEIRIRDNGAGIPADVKDRIFNPFFTTKPAGEGTGLGLSMSHDIVVKQHGGTIDVASEPGAFTEFVVTLPRRAPVTDAAGGPRT